MFLSYNSRLTEKLGSLGLPCIIKRNEVSLARREGSEYMPHLFVTLHRHFIGGKTSGGLSTTKT